MPNIRNTENKHREKFVLNREGEKDKPLKLWLTSWDIFKGYRYRKQYTKVNPKTGKTMVYQPYIPIKESSNHEFALIFPEWEKIIKCYFDVMRENLTASVKVQLPRNLGILEMCRIKKRLYGPYADRWTKKFLNLATMGYSPKMIWIRKHEKNFIHKMWYQFNLSRKGQWKHVGKALKEDPSIIFKWNNLS